MKTVLIVYILTNLLLASIHLYCEIRSGFTKSSLWEVLTLAFIGYPILLVNYADDILQDLPGVNLSFWFYYVFNRSALLLPIPELNALVKLHQEYTNTRIPSSGKVIWSLEYIYRRFIIRKQLDVNNYFGIKGLTRG